MKHFLAVLLCLLLCGCTGQASVSPLEAEEGSPSSPAVTGLYDPAHPMEAAYPGLVRAYPMNLRKVHGILPLKRDVVVLSGNGPTTLTRFTGENLREAASLTLAFPLQQEDPSLQIHETGLSFFDPQAQETLVLDENLREVRRIAAPDGLSGKPILSPGADILYYCTGWSVMAWDLESGIRRTVKEFSYEAQELTALHLEGQVLECTVRDQSHATKLYLSADHGQELHSLPENAMLYTGDTGYCACLSAGYQQLLIFGDGTAGAELLLPKQHSSREYYLPEDHAAVTVSSCAPGTQLDYYELNTGILRSSLTLPQLQTPKGIINCKGHSIYILAYDPEAEQDILYRWDVLRQIPDPANRTVYTAPYRGANDPDLEALEGCRQAAATIGEKYGIQILLWEDAAAAQPWDYRFQPEVLAPVLNRELDLLDQRLSQYPPEILEKTKAHFTGITLCLVRSITGAGEESSLSSATGIQFFRDGEAYAAITTGKYSQQALYHELYHVMETHILTESTALDIWESLNPAGFAYGSDQQNIDVYLQGQTRAFVDRYATSAMKEDRARVLENAMLPEQEGLFQSEYMQRKLTALCTGIREAYGLKAYPETLPWEQYLINPLLPGK